MKHLTDFASAWADMDSATPRQGAVIAVLLLVLFLFASVDWTAIG